MSHAKHTPLGTGCICQSCIEKRAAAEDTAPSSPISDDASSAADAADATTPRNSYALRSRDVPVVSPSPSPTKSPTKPTKTWDKPYPFLFRRLFEEKKPKPDTTTESPPPATPSASESRSPTKKPAMSSQQGKWREEQVLIICPGSQTTLAQLGCNELTPPAHRFPTRMFKGDTEDEWRPYHTYKRKKGGAANGASDAVAATDKANADDEDDDSYEWVEDTDSTEGAVYPIQAGRIVNMPAFLAFLDHVHSQLTTTYHNTPILLMASPQWVRGDVEMITRYIFEKTRTPALCIIHSGLATQYGLKWPSMTVVDIGFKKVDVTCIFEGSVVGHKELGYPGPERWISGGEVFTQKLLSLLKDKDFTYDMAEQLKKSHICEVLPYAPGKPNMVELPTASTAGAPPTGPEPLKPVIAAELPKPAAAPVADTDEAVDEMRADDDGVLDVASIVTSGNTREFLAKKEKEKGDKMKGRKAKAQETEAAKPVRLPNSKRTHNVFHYEEVVQEMVYPEPPAPVAAPVAVAATSNGTNGTNGAAPAAEEAKDIEMTDAAPAAVTSTEEVKPVDAPAEDEKPVEGEKAPEGEKAIEEKASEEKAPEAEKAPETTETVPAAAEVKPETADVPVSAPALAPAAAPAAEVAAVTAPVVPQEPRIENRRVRRDIEVGLERFTFADRDEIDRIVTTIYRTIQGLYEMYMRPACWDNIVFVGNGARLRGLKENIMQRLIARHLVSPSTATMFTSELPSNIATPTGTGAQTPTGSFTGVPHQLPNASSGVNPLLQAATTASGFGLAGGPGTPGGGAGSEIAGGHQHQHHFHSQTPTSIKLAPLPTYLSEWTKHGFEESMFLGSQVAARLAFCVHNLDMSGLEAQKMMSLSRVDYNELGPKGIREHSMLK